MAESCPNYLGAVVMNNNTAKTTVLSVAFFAAFGIVMMTIYHV